MLGAGTLPQRRPQWPPVVAIAVTIAPIVAATAAAWIEMSAPGESPMWIVAGVFFLACPGIGAVATERTGAPTAARIAVALALFVALWTIWIINVPVPTHPGVFFTGGSRLSGAVTAGLGAAAWLSATSSAAARIRKGSPGRGFAIGGVVFILFGAFAFYLGQMTP